MVVSLLTSLVLAITLTPSLAGWLTREREPPEHGHTFGDAEGGFLLRLLIRGYEKAVRIALSWRWLAFLGCLLVAGLGDDQVLP